MARQQRKIQVNLEMEGFEDHFSSLLLRSINWDSNYDCCLLAEDGQQISCHRMVLACASDFLRGLFQDISEEVLYVSIPGVDPETLRAIVTFIYSGEVSVSRESRAKFMQACRFFRLKAAEHISEVKVATEVETEKLAEDESSMDGANIEYLDEEEPSEPPEKKTRLESGEQAGSANAVPTSNRSQMKQECIKISVDSEPLRSSLMHRLDSVINNAYSVWNDTHGLQLSDEPLKSRLVLESKRLQKGSFDCNLCGKEISVVYTTDTRGRFKQWVNSNIRRHLLRVHPAKGTVS